MSDNPSQIATALIEQHGTDGALELVRREIAEVHAAGDNYRLSVWREVRRALQGQQDSTEVHRSLVLVWTEPRGAVH